MNDNCRPGDQGLVMKNGCQSAMTMSRQHEDKALRSDFMQVCWSDKWPLKLNASKNILNIFAMNWGSLRLKKLAINITRQSSHLKVTK